MNLQEQYDRLVNEHFGYEATDDVDGVMASLADEVEHHVVPSPVGILNDKDQIRGYYESLFRSLKAEGVTPVRRLYGDGFLVDEAIWEGRIEDGAPFLLDGQSGNVNFRILHVFEIADGKITRENVWCDLATIQQQLAGG